ncbi:hypothetical protein QJQ45_026901, partial [Haematococcus lacustris]
VAPRKPPQAPRSSQAATQAAASEPGPNTPLPAKRSKRTKAEPAAEPTKGKGKGMSKAAKAKPAPQPGRWLDRDCNAALNMQRIGESRWWPLELCYWPDQGALPAKGKEYPGLGYKRLRDKPPKAQQQQQVPSIPANRSCNKFEQELLGLEASVRALEKHVVQLKAHLQSERAVIPKVEALIAASKLQASDLHTITSHLPPHLPGLAGAVPQHLSKTNGDVKAPASSLPDSMQPLKTSASSKACKPGERREPVPHWYITEAELASVSGYMKGRLTLDKINSAVDELAGYAEANSKLLATARTAGAKMAGPERKRATELLHSIANKDGIKGRHWLCEGDFAKDGVHIRADKTGKSILTVLRHLGRLMAPRKPPQAPRSSQEATQAAASEPGPSTPPPARRSKRIKAEPAAEPNKGKGKGMSKAAKAKPAPQPGRWLDRDCNAALNMQRIGESRWRPLELCFWPDQGALPAKGKEYPGLGYKWLRDKPPKAQHQPVVAHRSSSRRGAGGGELLLGGSSDEEGEYGRMGSKGVAARGWRGRRGVDEEEDEVVGQSEEEEEEGEEEEEDELALMGLRLDEDEDEAQRERCLPQHCWLQMLEQLPVREVCMLARVNRWLRQLALQASVWQQCHWHIWGEAPDTKLDSATVRRLCRRSELKAARWRDAWPQVSMTGPLGTSCLQMDDSKVVSADGCMIRLWSHTTGRRLATLKGHAGKCAGLPRTVWGPRCRGRVTCLAFDEQLLVSGCSQAGLKVWSMDELKCSRSLRGHEGAITGVGILGHGMVVSGGEDGHIKVWDAASAGAVLDLDCGQPCGALQVHPASGRWQPREGGGAGWAQAAADGLGREQARQLQNGVRRIPGQVLPGQATAGCIGPLMRPCLPAVGDTLVTLITQLARAPACPHTALPVHPSAGHLVCSGYGVQLWDLSAAQLLHTLELGPDSGPLASQPGASPPGLDLHLQPNHPTHDLAPGGTSAEAPPWPAPWAVPEAAAPGSASGLALPTAAAAGVVDMGSGVEGGGTGTSSLTSVTYNGSLVAAGGGGCVAVWDTRCLELVGRLDLDCVVQGMQGQGGSQGCGQGAEQGWGASSKHAAGRGEEAGGGRGRQGYELGEVGEGRGRQGEGRGIGAAAAAPGGLLGSAGSRGQGPVQGSRCVGLQLDDWKLVVGCNPGRCSGSPAGPARGGLAGVVTVHDMRAAHTRNGRWRQPVMQLQAPARVNCFQFFEQELLAGLDGQECCLSSMQAPTLRHAHSSTRAYGGLSTPDLSSGPDAALAGPRGSSLGEHSHSFTRYGSHPKVGRQQQRGAGGGDFGMEGSSPLQDGMASCSPMLGGMGILDESPGGKGAGKGAARKKAGKVRNFPTLGYAEILTIIYSLLVFDCEGKDVLESNGANAVAIALPAAQS